MKTPSIAFRARIGMPRHLVDLRTETEYRSPLDVGGTAGDVGYLAGIHAIGANGVVHYLENHLGELYREVWVKRFSTRISYRYDPKTLEVLESSRVTPIYRHEA